MSSIWQNNKLLKKWEQKNFRKIANGNFNYNLAYPLEDPLLNAIAKDLKIKREYVYVGAGSSQFISSIVSLKCWNRIFLSDIEFSLYKRTALLFEKKLKILKSRTTTQFVESLKKVESNDKDLLCISSPRWFSGELFTKVQIKSILNYFKGTLLIDEAYIDYSNDDKGMLNLCLKNDRIILLRSFSKKFLASGFRVGYMISKKEIQGMRNTVIPPHSISSYSENFFVNLLSDKKILEAFVDTRNYIKNNRDLIYENLKNNENFEIIKSNANFISLIFYDKKTMEIIYDSLKDLEGIQKFDEIIPFIKIWVNNEVFSKIIIDRIKGILK